MEKQLEELLSELVVFGHENDGSQAERNKKMLNLDPQEAQLMSIMVRSGQRKRLLEIGTSNGYSSIWLAWSVQFTGGHLISLERDADKQAMADANLKRAGLRDKVDLLLGDATELVSQLKGTFDFVFFDADRLSAPEQLKLLLPKLEAGALLLADNVLSHPEQIAPYLEAISSLPEFEHMVIPIGKGLSVAYKQG